MKNSKEFADLCDVLAKIAQSGDMRDFILDLCTPQEIKAMAERWQICQMLHHAGFSYREIHEKTGVSLTTIGRVARFLKNESNEGYKKALEGNKDISAMNSRLSAN